MSLGIEFLLFCLGTVGMTAIIVQGVIFHPIRHFFAHWADKHRERREQRAEQTGTLPMRTPVEWFTELIHCVQCTGFWCGMFCGMLIVEQYIAALPLPLLLLLWFCCGTAGSFLSFFALNMNDWFFFQARSAERSLTEREERQETA